MTLFADTDFFTLNCSGPGAPPAESREASAASRLLPDAGFVLGTVLIALGGAGGIATAIAIDFDLRLGLGAILAASCGLALGVLLAGGLVGIARAMMRLLQLVMR